MTPPDKLLVAMATYNERDNLPDMVRQVLAVVPGAELLVVDDNSPDGTGQWAAEQAAADRRISCLHRPRKMGLGSATIAALRHAVQHAYTYVVLLDADGSHDPREIPQMLERISSAQAAAPDIVIGSRYVPGGSTIGWPWYRRWMSRSINAFARLMLGLPVRDCSGAFRCIRVALLERVDLDSIRSHGYACLEEILWRFKQVGARFEEIPIVFANRQRGHSKINTRESLAALWMLFRLGLRNWFRV
ncbi:MAG: polyprenol monophosphomannose synthase [Planctomycetaceae bacterium]|nr:polyprenol monophosphomannose synthase [Planctomycetaceae bacterium]